MRYLLFLALFIVLPFSLQAKEHEGESGVADVEKAEDVEKLEVLGSHIKKIATEGPSPVLVIDREQIEMSGYNSLSDVLRELPVASFGGQKEVALGYPSSKTGTSLRGMKSHDVLVLLNYRRLPPLGGSNSVDLSIIPLSAVDKIEILQDGASAIYGSDAVGGVINIVTKKGDVGGQVNVQGSLVQREEGNSLEALGSFVDFWNWNDEDNIWNGKGDRLSIDVSYGGNKGDTNYLIGAQARFNTSMYWKDRKFSEIEVDDYSEYGSPGSWLNIDKKEPFPGCPSERVKEGHCKWDYTPYMQSLPQMFQGSVFAQADTEIDSGFYASATGIYSYTKSLARLAPAPLVGLSTEGVPVEIAQKWGLNAQGSDNVKVFYRPVHEKGVGQRKFDSNNHSYQIQANVVKEFSDTLELDANISASGSHYLTTARGFLLQSKLFELTNQGKFNPTLPKDKKSDLSTATHEVGKETHSNLFSFEPQLSGAIEETDNMSLFFAVGGLGAWQWYLEEGDEESQAILKKGDQILGGDVAVDGEGDRWFSSLYGELSLLAFDIFELQVAARTDYYHYSDSDTASGFTEQTIPFTDDVSMPISPRLALVIQPVNEVKLRASWGMGFRAPSLVAIHQNETTTHPFSIDYVQCPESSYDKDEPKCGKSQRVLKLSGNKELKPENFHSFSTGLVLQPVEQLAFNVDYFIISRENVIMFYNETLDDSLRDVLKYEQQNGAEALKKNYDITIERNKDGAIAQVKAKPFNSSYDLSHGFNLGLDISPIPIWVGWDLGFQLEHSHMIYNEYQAFEDSDIEVPIPYYGEGVAWVSRPRWRNRAVLSVMNKDMGHNFQLIVHNIPGQQQLPESKAEMDDYWQLDLAGKIALGKKTSLTVGIQNVLGLDRPENDENNTATGYVDSYLYSLRGRTLNARVTYNFQ